MGDDAWPKRQREDAVLWDDKFVEMVVAEESREAVVEGSRLNQDARFLRPLSGHSPGKGKDVEFLVHAIEKYLPAEDKEEDEKEERSRKSRDPEPPPHHDNPASVTPSMSRRAIKPRCSLRMAPWMTSPWTKNEGGRALQPARLVP
ncbi:uncharacterized protein LY89DRAFT_672868 [Mollisia scopiformis]|uniref:Uncharacterized protein n=1 Tax=Mollisia scopiformis TaxID=149040 RepID=A0A194WXS1_MOLSC|nr:uncharacterized protein LY89DRAFT_672868 [Mollisia scopiformis]KUJ12730.1 hypothetical protein LY89DRAFT_672868 [Mollisia scopiformis]